MILKDEKHIQVTIKNRCGTSVILALDPFATIGFVTNKIEEGTQVPVHVQKLIANEVILKDSKSLSDYGIYHNCTILIDLR